MSAPWQPEQPVGRGEVLRLIRAEIAEIRNPRPQIVPVAPQTVINIGNGNFGPTVIDLSSWVPAGATIAVILCSIGGTRVSNGAFAQNYLEFFRESGGLLAARVGISYAEAGASGSGAQVLVNAYVPLAANRTFAYTKTDGLSASSGAVGVLIGYMI